MTRLRSIFDFIYKRIFNEPVTQDAFNFANSLLHVGIGSLIGAGFTIGFNMFAGRWMGSTAYGEFTLTMTIGLFMFTTMLLGISTAMAKYNSEVANDLNRQREIISTSYILSFICSSISVLFYLTFSSTISKILSVSNEVFDFAIIFALLYTFYTLTSSTLRSLHKMKAYSLFKALNGMLLFLSLVIFVLFSKLSFHSMVYSTYLANLAAGALILISIRKYLIKSFNEDWARIIWNYSSYAAFSGISFILYTNIDKIFINAYLTVTDVGIYNAYVLSSINLMDLFSDIFITVFFPFASKSKRKEIIWDKLNKLIKLLIIFGIPSIIIAEYVILTCFGNSYPKNISLIFIFAVTAIMATCYRLYSWLFNSVGTEGVKITFQGTVTVAIVNIILNILLVPILGLYGAVGATLLAYSIGIYQLIIRKNKLTFVENNRIKPFLNKYTLNKKEE
jgi:O-antigen/teichoic acid export membrane protein